jgi:hypothetical protein
MVPDRVPDALGGVLFLLTLFARRAFGESSITCSIAKIAAALTDEIPTPMIGVRRL